MKRNLVVLLLMISSFQVQSQQNFSEHYYKRWDLFKSQSDTENEIIFLGNSITEGGNWKELFPLVNAVNRGISGDITDGILFRLEEITSAKPLKLFLLIGTNDLARGKSVEAVFLNTKKILHKIQALSPSTKIFLQSVLPYNSNVGGRFKGHKSKQQEVLILNKRLKVLASTLNLTYIDLHKKFRNSKGELKSELTHDGLHLNNEGYLFWKAIINKHIQ